MFDLKIKWVRGARSVWKDRLFWYHDRTRGMIRFRHYLHIGPLWISWFTEREDWIRD